MEIGTTLYVKDRRQWRAWLARHHKTAPEIWLIYYKKHSGRPRIPYSDAVEEALCYGWIDSITKPGADRARLRSRERHEAEARVAGPPRPPPGPQNRAGGGGKHSGGSPAPGKQTARPWRPSQAG